MKDKVIGDRFIDYSLVRHSRILLAGIQSLFIRDWIPA